MTFSRQVDRHRRAVGVFPERRDAEQALHELRDSGFPMDRVSIIARDSERQDNIAGAEVHDRVGNKADEGAKVGAVSGGALGGITGLLVGLGTLAIPGIGPILLAGAGATVLATTAAGVGIGAAAGGLLGALIGLGIPEERARIYNDRVAHGQYLVMVEGTDQELARAETILHRRGIEEYGVYDMPASRTHETHVHETRTHENGVTSQAVPAAGVIPDAYAATTTHSGVAGERKRGIGVFSNRRDAEAALTELRDSGFSMDQVSIIAKDSDHHGNAANLGANVGTNVRDVNRNTKADEGAKAGAATGGALGGLGGLLVGLGALALPGVGPVILGGAAATALGTAISGGAIGAAVGGLTGGLVGLGIPEDRARVYNDRFSHGDYLVMVDGTEADLRRAEAVLNRRGIRDWNMFDAADPAHPNHLRTGMR